VRRTADRPLAKQSVSPAEALALFGVLGIIALALLIPLNRPTQVLALIGGVLAVTYPFLKRFFALPQAYLGLAFSWSVPMAFAAQTGELPTIAWVLFVAGVMWTTAYDTIYAMVDREDDLVIGIRSSAILFGRADRGIIATLQVGSLAGLALVGRLASMGRWYWTGLAVAAALAVYQQVLIRDRNPSDCFRAFLNNNLFGLAIFGGILLDYLFRT
jgi:4-hydroxybenzoate polyprenyltransferase